MFGVKSLQNPSLPASRRLSYAFYVCCLNLNGDTSSKGEQICLELEEAEWKCYCGGLGGVGLRLALARGRGDETPLSIRTAFTLLAKSSECFEFNLGRVCAKHGEDNESDLSLKSDIIRRLSVKREDKHQISLSAFKYRPPAVLKTV